MRRAERDEDGVLSVDGVAHDAAVEDVPGDDPHAPGEIAELLGGADQRGHGVTAPERAPGKQPPGAAGGSDDENVHARIVPGRGLAVRSPSAAAWLHPASDATTASPVPPGGRRSQRRLRLCAGARRPPWPPG